MLFSLTYNCALIIQDVHFYLGKHYLLIRVHKVVAFVEHMCKLPSCVMTDKVVLVHENGMYMYIQS